MGHVRNYSIGDAVVLGIVVDCVILCLEFFNADMSLRLVEPADLFAFWIGTGIVLVVVTSAMIFVDMVDVVGWKDQMHW